MFLAWMSDDNLRPDPRFELGDTTAGYAGEVPDSKCSVVAGGRDKTKSGEGANIIDPMCVLSCVEATKCVPICEGQYDGFWVVADHDDLLNVDEYCRGPWSFENLGFRETNTPWVNVAYDQGADLGDHGPMWHRDHERGGLAGIDTDRAARFFLEHATTRCLLVAMRWRWTPWHCPGKYHENSGLRWASGFVLNERRFTG